jgi:hypothetical protein
MGHHRHEGWIDHGQDYKEIHGPYANQRGDHDRRFHCRADKLRQQFAYDNGNHDSEPDGESHVDGEPQRHRGGSHRKLGNHRVSDAAGDRRALVAHHILIKGYPCHFDGTACKSGYGANRPYPSPAQIRR